MPNNPDVLVIGGTGWVGHQIALAFDRAGYQVTICSRGMKSLFAKAIPKRFQRIVADKNQAADMDRVLAQHYQVVVDSVPGVVALKHLAKYPEKIGHYLHCSSTGGYTPMAHLPGDETMTYRGWGEKEAVDTLALKVYQQVGLKTTVIRPPVILGPGALPVDNLGGRSMNFIPDILNEARIDVANDGMALFQPVHVVSLADAFVLAAQNPDSAGQIYNICQEKAVTVARYLQLVAEALNRKANLNFLPMKDMLMKYFANSDGKPLLFLMEHMCFDISKAKQQLAYCPYPSTEKTIVETARWAAGNKEEAWRNHSKK